MSKPLIGPEYESTFIWDDLRLEAWDEERKCWCKIKEIDIENDDAALSNGVVRFHRKLSTLRLKHSGE